LSQKPYLPLGSLREALYYPRQVEHAGTLMAPAGIEHQQQAALASSHHAPSNLDALMNAHDDDLSPEPEASALARPDHGTGAGDGRAIDVLGRVQLGHLADRLDQVGDWGRILSLGEQQRLAFGRLLLAEPQAAFLDEATSAMDEGLEDAMYRLVRERLPNTILLSVGHRSTLFAHHARQLILERAETGRWQIVATSHQLRYRQFIL